MGSASVTVNVFDDSGTGHVSISVTDPTGKSVSYERQLDTRVIAASVFEGGALDGVIMVGSSLGPDDGVNQKID